MWRVLIFWILGLPVACAWGQGSPASSPVAVELAKKSLAALIGTTIIHDVTLTGSASTDLTAETGSITLMALGNGESRIDIALSDGTRSEIRDASTGLFRGKWIAPDSTSGKFAAHNCQTDAAWFFPVFSSLSAGRTVVLSYIGQETRNGTSVQHIRSFHSGESAGEFGPAMQTLSTMDWYLDDSTLLPVATTFYIHPDNNAGNNLLVEVDYSNFQKVEGAVLPMHIQRFQQGNLMLDIQISTVAFNTGLNITMFSVN